MKILKKMRPQNKYIQYCHECGCKLLINYKDITDIDENYLFGKFTCPFCNIPQYLSDKNMALVKHYERFGKKIKWSKK